jgi:hypothetical protein
VVSLLNPDLTGETKDDSDRDTDRSADHHVLKQSLTGDVR